MPFNALLVGVFEASDTDRSLQLTRAASDLDRSSNGKFIETLKIAGRLSKRKVRILYNISTDYPIVAAVGLGPANAGYNESEDINEARENVRGAVAAGLRSLRDMGADIAEVVVEGCNDPEAAAEGALLGLFVFEELKSEKYKKNPLRFSFLDKANHESNTKWERGITLATGQNIVRRLEEMPANLMTPADFVKTVSEIALPLAIKVEIRDKSWIEGQKMNSFLSVAQGSPETPPLFLELHYNNAPAGQKPLALVGKGITFDSGGISLKPRENMDKQRADMGGAANVVGAIITLAALKAPVNVVGFTPLTHNMLSGTATKPGDVVIARNGKSIQVDNTDAEGRLVLADALDYAHDFNPRAIVDLATLTGAVKYALGSGAAGIYSTSTPLYETMRKAGVETGDRVWRMPLYKIFTRNTTDSQLADCLNIAKSPGGGSCIAAAFLREFVTHDQWIHMDIAGVKETSDEVPYLSKGMSGRPMRTLVTFAESLFAN